MNKQPIGIIGAMAVEVNTLIAAMENKTVEIIAGLGFYSGTLAGVDCVVACCGAGKVNSGACAQIMILQYAARLVINVGVAGGIGEGVKIGNLVIARACVEYDYDTTAVGEPLGNITIWRDNREKEEIVELPCDDRAAREIKIAATDIYGGVHMGIVATGDAFVGSKEKSLWIAHRFGAMAVEMEGGSIAHVCYMNNTPCAVLRAISDNANDDANVDFHTFVTEAAEKSADLLIKALPRL